VTINHHSFQLTATVSLPEHVGFHETSSGTVAVAADQANWITLLGEEAVLLRLLLADLTPEEALEAAVAKSPEKHSEISFSLKTLLTKIGKHRFLRDFIAHEQIQKNVAHLYLTNACNLRCKHCYMKSGKPEPGALGLDHWLDFLREFRSFGGTHVNLSGGEALSYDGFWPILEECGRLGLNVYVLSNGLLVNETAARRIAELAYQIQISVDGPTPASNDSLRGTGSFEKAMQGLYHFRGLNITTRVAMVTTPATIADFEANFVPFARKLYQDFGDQLQLRVSVDVIEGRSVKRYTPEVKESLQKRVDQMFDALWGYDTRSHSDAIGFKRGLLNKNCGFGREISVKSNGEVYPCPIQIAPIGRLGADDVVELFRRTRIEDREKQIDTFLDCKSCDLRYLCGGGCRVANFEMTGDYRKPYFCNDEYKRRTYERLSSADAFVDRVAPTTV
jgi:radical SAM protein with 4Fe4S-binding SPASM domain